MLSHSRFHLICFIFENKRIKDRKRERRIRIREKLKERGIEEKKRECNTLILFQKRKECETREKTGGYAF